MEDFVFEFWYENHYSNTSNILLDIHDQILTNVMKRLLKQFSILTRNLLSGSWISQRRFQLGCFKTAFIKIASIQQICTARKRKKKVISGSKRFHFKKQKVTKNKTVINDLFLKFILNILHRDVLKKWRSRQAV